MIEYLPPFLLQADFMIQTWKKSNFSVQQSRMQKESDETSESEIEDDDDDDEEDFDVQVDLESNLQSVCRFPEELRSTHFIAIRLVLKNINH